MDLDIDDIKSVLVGDGAAYARIVSRHQDEIARRMWRFTRDKRELEELVQEVFVEAYYSLSGFRGEAPFLHWINRIATRVGYRYWKKRHKQQSGQVSLQDWDGFKDIEQREVDAAEAGELAHNLLAKLPPRDRLVLTLLYMEELSVAQAAQRLGWSQVMVKVQAHRARKKLKTICDKMGL